MTPFRGVVVPTVTLFHEDGSIDWDANASHIERLLHAGVHGIFVLGSTGEAQHLTLPEREEMIRWASETVAKRVPLYAGVGDTCVAETEALIRASEEAGVDALVAVGPYFWRLGERHLHAHFRSLAESTPLPLILYNFPSLVGADLSVDLVRRLADECPTIVGVKETLDSGTHMRRMAVHLKQLRGDFSVFCGHDDLYLFALTAGLDGVVSSTANFAPDLFVNLWRSYEAGAFEVAEPLSRKIGRLVEVYAADPCGASVVKAAMHLRGWIETPLPRPPALLPDSDALEAMRQVMTKTHLLDEEGGNLQS